MVEGLRAETTLRESSDPFGKGRVVLRNNGMALKLRAVVENGWKIAL